MGFDQMKIILKEIQEVLSSLSKPEILQLDRQIHEYLDTMAFSKAAESAFSEWNDPEEGIYQPLKKHPLSKQKRLQSSISL
jgi:hypothetical protein